MLIIGERINSTRKAVCEAMRNRDTGYIQMEARKQVEAGAHYIDCNAAAVGVENEVETLCWAVQAIQTAVDVPVAIDSPNPDAIVAAVKVHRGTPIINSISAETAKFEELLPVVKECEAMVIALCMDERGMPEDADDRIRIGTQLVQRLLDAGVPAESIMIDPLVLPIGVNTRMGCEVLSAIRGLKERFPDVKVVIGLTNISHGLPNRAWLNRAFLILAMHAGLDAVICDPTDKQLMALMMATDALLGHDEFCANYIAAARSGRL
ncbi:MAG TPA: methyltetrahydrofolate cobalamin methyltransferase, partial [Armatimonadetes bacterium]|nr:methyltetrahydrofolate cobalamin methyltransferase [Armatimonadota bacterium]